MRHQKNANKPKETFGFKSVNNAEPVPELKEFEEKLYEITKNVEFKDAPNKLQTKLKSDIRKIQNDPKVFCPADKTTNFYKVEPQTAEALIKKEITKDYVKAEKVVIIKVTKEAQYIVKKLYIQDRVFATVKQEAFSTLKDHKPNFKNNPTFRLINSLKPYTGKISQKLLSRVIREVKSKSGLTQWQNTYETKQN